MPKHLDIGAATKVVFALVPPNQDAMCQHETLLAPACNMSIKSTRYPPASEMKSLTNSSFCDEECGGLAKHSRTSGPGSPRPSCVDRTGANSRRCCTDYDPDRAVHSREEARKVPLTPAIAQACIKARPQACRRVSANRSERLSSTLPARLQTESVTQPRRWGPRRTLSKPSCEIEEHVQIPAVPSRDRIAAGARDNFRSRAEWVARVGAQKSNMDANAFSAPAKLAMAVLEKSVCNKVFLLAFRSWRNLAQETFRSTTFSGESAKLRSLKATCRALESTRLMCDERRINAENSMTAYWQELMTQNDLLRAAEVENKTLQQTIQSLKVDLDASESTTCQLRSEVAHLKSQRSEQSQHSEISSMCVVCMATPAEIAFVPCGHVALCGSGCPEHLRDRRCPVCRETVVQQLRIYRP